MLVNIIDEDRLPKRWSDHYLQPSSLFDYRKKCKITKVNGWNFATDKGST